MANNPHLRQTARGKVWKDEVDSSIDLEVMRELAHLPQYALGYTGLFSSDESYKLSKDLHPRVHKSDHIYGSNPQGILSEVVNEFESEIKRINPDFRCVLQKPESLSGGWYRLSYLHRHKFEANLKPVVLRVRKDKSGAWEIIKE